MKPTIGLALVAALAGLASADAQAQPAAVVRGTVTLSKDGSPKKDRSGVVVYLEAVNTGATPPGAPRVIHQRDLAFLPNFAVIVKGTTIDFPNDDKVFHNVFSVSKAARFDLGLYKSGSSKSVTFATPGVVDVYCNIHPQMQAKIKVLDNPYFAVTAADGSFRIPAVPPGTYTVVAWQPFGEERRGEVKVTAAGAQALTFSLAEGDRPQNHTRKDGTPYGRYK